VDETNRAQRFEPVKPRHEDVEQDHVRHGALAQRGEQGIAAVEGLGLVAPGPQQCLEVLGKLLVVVNDGECRGAHTCTNGKRNPTDARWSR